MAGKPTLRACDAVTALTLELPSVRFLVLPRPCNAGAGGALIWEPSLGCPTRRRAGAKGEGEPGPPNEPRRRASSNSPSRRGVR